MFQVVEERGEGIHIYTGGNDNIKCDKILTTGKSR